MLVELNSVYFAKFRRLMDFQEIFLVFVKLRVSNSDTRLQVNLDLGSPAEEGA